ncbi:type IV pilus secretin PilQ, partial [Vibrio parahaemolyticus]|nr:type IV pilus secretin PilQ [Vibrio parahaemolyticus]
MLTGLFSLWLFVFLAPLVAAEEVSSNALKSIDFRTNKDKDAVIVVELASPAAIVDIKRVQEGLSIDLLNNSVKDEQLYLLDVKDFSTVVESVEVFRDTSTTRLVAHINEEYMHDYRLTGRFLEIKVAKIKPNEKAPDKSILEREGKLISINFQDIPVRNVLQLIADYN